MKKIFDKVAVAAMIGYACMSSAFAQSQFKLNDIKNSSGAGNQDLAALATKSQNLAQTGSDTWLIWAALAGVVTFSLSLWACKKAAADDRDKPKGAIAGLIIGACLTAIPLLLGLTRNSINIGG